MNISPPSDRAAGLAPSATSGEGEAKYYKKLDYICLFTYTSMQMSYKDHYKLQAATRELTSAAASNSPKIEEPISNILNITSITSSTCVNFFIVYGKSSRSWHS